MAKQGRLAAGEERPFKVREVRKMASFLPDQRDRLNWTVEWLGVANQNDALKWLLDGADVPPDARPSDAWIERRRSRPRSRRAGNGTNAQAQP